MQLGAFSISLPVKDLVVSKTFYEKLGFEVFGGNIEENWLMMKNGDHKIGLFQGMFDQNILTFNPGWDQDANIVSDFTDVRDLQKKLVTQGINLEVEADIKGVGPAYILFLDPDGNTIMIDQHV